MKKRYLSIFIAGLICLCNPIISFGAVIDNVVPTDIQGGKTKFTVNGTIPVADRNNPIMKDVFLQILKVEPDELYTTYQNNLSGAIVYFGKTTAGADGSYSFNDVTATLTTGSYYIVVGFNGNAGISERTYRYDHLEATEKATIIGNAASGDKTKVKTALTTLNGYGMLVFPATATPEEEAAWNTELDWCSECIAQTLTPADIDEISDIDSAFATARELYAFNALNSSSLQTYFADSDNRAKLSVPDNIYTSFSGMDTTAKAGIISLVEGTEFFGYSDIKKVFCDNVILKSIEGVVYQTIQKVLADNKTYLELDKVVTPGVATVWQTYESLNEPDIAASNFAGMVSQISDVSDITTLFAKAVNERKKYEDGNPVIIPSNPPSSPPSGGSGVSSKTEFSGVGKNEEPYIEDLTSEAEPAFDDMENAKWATEAVEYLYSRKIVAGRAEKKFVPNDNIKREEFVKLIVEAFELANKTDETNFSDVPFKHWSELYIAAAVDNEIVSGIDETTFGLGRNITRRDMAVMLYRAISTMGKETPDLIAFKFSDVPDSDYGFEAVNALFNCGILNGTGDNKFSPDGGTTRAEAAKALYEMLVYFDMKK